MFAHPEEPGNEAEGSERGAGGPGEPTGGAGIVAAELREGSEDEDAGGEEGAAEVDLGHGGTGGAPEESAGAGVAAGMAPGEEEEEGGEERGGPDLAGDADDVGIDRHESDGPEPGFAGSQARGAGFGAGCGIGCGGASGEPRETEQSDRVEEHDEEADADGSLAERNQRDEGPEAESGIGRADAGAHASCGPGAGFEDGAGLFDGIDLIGLPLHVLGPEEAKADTHAEAGEPERDDPARERGVRRQAGGGEWSVRAVHEERVREVGGVSRSRCGSRLLDSAWGAGVEHGMGPGGAPSPAMAGGCGDFVEQLSADARPVPSGGARACRRGEFAAAAGQAGDGFERAGDGRDIPGFEGDSGGANDLGKRAGGGIEDGGAAGHGLDRGEAEAFEE